MDLCKTQKAQQNQTNTIKKYLTMNLAMVSKFKFWKIYLIKMIPLWSVRDECLKWSLVVERKEW